MINEEEYKEELDDGEESELTKLEVQSIAMAWH